MRNYSRLASVEEKKNIRRAVIFLILTGTTVVLLLTIGLPTLAKFSSFLSNLTNPQKTLDKADTTPPAPPRISDLPDFTNKDSLDIKGTAEPNSKVKIFVNAKEYETEVDKDGNFKQKVQLNMGGNSISALDTDQAGNQSQKTDRQKVTLDKESPSIKVDSPTEGAEFFGDKQKQVTIKGATKVGSTLSINDRFVSVDDSGNFSYSVNLSSGENNFALMAVDKAGNTSEKSLKVTFTP